MRIRSRTSDYEQGVTDAPERFTGESVADYFAEASDALKRANDYTIRQNARDYWRGYHDGIVAAAVARFDS